MPDIRLKWSADDLSADLVLSAEGAIETGHDLVTAAVVSLLSDRLADETDPLPDESGDRRGWWADDGAAAIWGPGAEAFGSRLWLISREKATEAVRVRAELYIAEALEWMTKQRIVSRFDISTEWRGEPKHGFLAARVVAHREGGDPVSVLFEPLWRELA